MLSLSQMRMSEYIQHEEHAGKSRSWPVHKLSQTHFLNFVKPILPQTDPIFSGQSNQSHCQTSFLISGVLLARSAQLPDRAIYFLMILHSSSNSNANNR